LDLECLAGQGHGHLGRDDLVAADNQEVDVGDGVAHRVALHVTGQGEEGLIAGLQLKELVGAGLTGKGDAQLSALDGDGDRLGAVP